MQEVLKFIKDSIDVRLKGSR